MSKQRNEDQLLEEPADLTPAVGEAPVESNAQNNDPGDTQTPLDNLDQDPDKTDKPEELLAIEEHARRLNIDKPVFAAVIQSEKWAGGKKVSEADFKKAVEGFLSAPMGGGKPPEGGLK
jgi:hypothetical protein